MRNIKIKLQDVLQRISVPANCFVDAWSENIKADMSYY